MSRTHKRNNDFSKKDREKNKKKKLDRIKKMEDQKEMKTVEKEEVVTELPTTDIDLRIFRALNREEKLTPMQKRNQARLEKILAKRGETK